MTPNDPHLLELFWGLRQAGLPLRIEDYQLLSQAWEKGFRPENYEELRQLCRRLWVKSLAEKDCFEKYFDQYLQRWSSQPEKPSSYQDKPPNTDPLKDEDSTKTPSPLTQPKQPDITAPDGAEELQVGQAVPQFQQTNKQIPPSRFTLTDEYFPVTRRQLQQGWRKLRQPVREGPATELNISATVKLMSQQGFFLEPVLIPSRVNQTKLLLLIDQSNSMMPFAPLAERLTETAVQEGRLGETKTYYFRNSPKGFLYSDLDLQDFLLYSDLDLLQKQPLTGIIPHLHKNHTVVLIFSDGGSARGGFNQKRVELTAQFLAQIRPVVRQVAWLNPLPANRWRGTTANWVARLVSMYPFSLTEWRRMIDELRGRQTPLKEYDYQDTTETGSLDKEPNFPKQVQKRLKDLPARTPSEEFSRYESAARYIADFANWGQAHLDLAYHAAFPLALTANLLYYLRENFPYDKKGKWLNIPWLAVPDLLLSNLCHPAGHQLYEMDSAVRHLLLKLLQTDERFGNQRLDELSDCLLFYMQQRFENTDLDLKDFGEHPEWIALAYTKPNEVARKLAQMLEKIYSGDKAEKVRRASLTATFAEPLAEAGFQPLLTFAQGWGRLARGYEEGANELFDQLPEQSSELVIEGVKLRIPNRRDLLRFSFDVVTVNSRGKIIKRERHQAQYFKEDLGNKVVLEMVAIPGGTFLMGSPETEAERSEYEGPQHQVTVPPFFMGKYPVTQAQWQAVAAFPQVNRELDPDPSEFKGGDRPVERISWYDAVEFCARLSKATGRDYRLPSEAEWEYACRAGTITPFHFGETITSKLANYSAEYTYGDAPKGKSSAETTPVGSFQVANSFGLFDMHGNVWEWCADAWHSYGDTALTKDSGDVESDNDNQSRMLRGGSWFFGPRHCRSASRDYNDRGYWLNLIGFRVVVSRART